MFGVFHKDIEEIIEALALFNHIIVWGDASDPEQHDDLVKIKSYVSDTLQKHIDASRVTTVEGVPDEQVFDENDVDDGVLFVMNKLSIPVTRVNVKAACSVITSLNVSKADLFNSNFSKSEFIEKFKHVSASRANDWEG